MASSSSGCLAKTPAICLMLILSINLGITSKNKFAAAADTSNRHLYSVDETHHGLTFTDNDGSKEKKDGSADGRGTCTCTCETKPVDAAAAAPATASATSGIEHPLKPPERYIPQTASLIRTAVKTPPNENRQKQQQQPQEEQEQVYDVNSGIVNVPPMEDFLLDNGAAYMEPDQSNIIEPSQEQSVVETPNQQQENDAWEQERFPWKLLPDTMCFREMCTDDRECCRRFNLCDRSALVCVDCWYGSTCTSERDCCLKYPYCQRDWRTDSDGSRRVVGGKCTNEL